MKKNVKYTLIAIILACSSINLGHAFDLDETVDDEIRKNYNPSQLVNDVGIKDTALEKKIDTLPQTYVDPQLPTLPSITTKGNIGSNAATIKESQYLPYKGGNIKVKAGTTFNVNSNNTISDWQVRGNTVTFTLQKAKYGRGFTIPAGTLFKGEVVESHQPQLTCNGGLVAVKIYTMIHNGQSVPIDAFITRANDKKIFLNTIKGKRTYLKTMWEKGNWGRTIFNRMATLTVNLGGEGSTLILAPFPLAYGTLCVGASAITSPICAFFSKGEHISIPAGSPFRIKLNEDVMIN